MCGYPFEWVFFFSLSGIFRRLCRATVRREAYLGFRLQLMLLPFHPRRLGEAARFSRAFLWLRCTCSFCYPMASASAQPAALSAEQAKGEKHSSHRVGFLLEKGAGGGYRARGVVAPPGNGSTRCHLSRRGSFPLERGNLGRVYRVSTASVH